MNKKKILAGIMSGAITISSCFSVLTYASENIFKLCELFPYADSATVKPKITVESLVLDTSAAGKEQNIKINFSGANGAYAATGMHLYYDNRLTIPLNNRGRMSISNGDAITDLSVNSPKVDPLATEEAKSVYGTGFNGVFFSTAGSANDGCDGTMYTITFKLPDILAGGEVFPIDIIYKSVEGASDLFYDSKRQNHSMSAYTFTRGIYNTITNNNFKASDEDIKRVPSLEHINSRLCHL